MRHVFYSALVLLLFTSCIYAPKELEKSVVGTEAKLVTSSTADCAKVSTPKEVPDYYLCVGPMGYCWLAEGGGISCIPRPPDYPDYTE